MDRTVNFFYWFTTEGQIVDKKGVKTLVNHSNLAFQTETVAKLELLFNSLAKKSNSEFLNQYLDPAIGYVIRASIIGKC